MMDQDNIAAVTMTNLQKGNNQLVVNVCIHTLSLYIFYLFLPLITHPKESQTKSSVVCKPPSLGIFSAIIIFGSFAVGVVIAVEAAVDPAIFAVDFAVVFAVVIAVDGGTAVVDCLNT